MAENHDIYFLQGHHESILTFASYRYEYLKEKYHNGEFLAFCGLPFFRRRPKDNNPGISNVIRNVVLGDIILTILTHLLRGHVIYGLANSIR